MKKLLLLFVMLNLFHQLSAQGTITGFQLIPSSPTVNDPVKVIADVMFTSGDCQLAQQGHSTTAERTDAYAHHCIGALTVICTTTDTFELGALSAGNHTFVLTLTSGGGPVPCTPGIVPDDKDSITFTVDPGVGLQEVIAQISSLYPNPASTSIQLSVGSSSWQGATASVYNSIGELLFQSTIKNQTSTINIATLISGIYYIHLQTEECVAVKKFEVIR